MDDRLSCPTAQPFGSHPENVWNPIFYLQMPTNKSRVTAKLAETAKLNQRDIQVIAPDSACLAMNIQKYHSCQTRA